MNSLNILSGRISPVQTPSPSRSNSFGTILSTVSTAEAGRVAREQSLDDEQEGESSVLGEANDTNRTDETHDKLVLLGGEKPPCSEVEVSGWLVMPKRVASAFIESLRWLLSAVATPGIYLITLLYGEEGVLMPFSLFRGSKPATTAQSAALAAADGDAILEKTSRKGATGRRMSTRGSRLLSSNSSSSGMSSDSELERDSRPSGLSHRGSRAKLAYNSDEISPARRSIRIKLHNEDNPRQRTHRRTQSTQKNGIGSGLTTEITPATLKSPISPSSSLSMTKYPRAPAPPRPLVPRRQPSFTIQESSSGRPPQKTLILDLDETLIHSMAKGGRMGSGHMVEVKLNTIVGTGSGATPGPQHPILYYVHKRPHCDEFLRKICKWYNLVIFTASVQEYADPVIDWLEQERKFFSGRYYRQHCTYRHNAFIKDLSSVEPDLSKVMILDNSPLSYMFHQDNAIPIEGWINDPSDNDLLHLVPLLEGLQHVTDVRAFLALRGGEDGKHIA